MQHMGMSNKKELIHFMENPGTYALKVELYI